MKKIIFSTLIILSSLAAFCQKRIAPVKTAEERLNEAYCTGMFKTIDGTYFDMQNDHAAFSANGYLNILDWLQGRVAGLQVYTNRNNDLIPFIRNNRAGIYIDEIYQEPGFLNLLAVSDIAMIKIIKGPFAGSYHTPGGVIAIYTIGADEYEPGD